jgi:two-component system cell cycle response regulator DivK
LLPSCCVSTFTEVLGGKHYRSSVPLILSVDDHEDDRLLSTLILDSLGYTHISASEGLSALKLAQRYQPSIILLDLCLPGMGGLEVVRHLKQDSRTAAIPVIALTAMAVEDNAKQILAAGFNGYLAKPYSIEELEALLHHHLTPFTEQPEQAVSLH